MKRLIMRAALLVLVLAQASPSQAQAQTTPAGPPAETEDKAGMMKMMQAMGRYTGNPDIDFATNMIPHHQGAIDMAETELRYGKDPEMRTLATDILAAQRKEIALMKDWLARHGH